LSAHGVPGEEISRRHGDLSAPVVGQLVGLLSVTLIAFWFENQWERPPESGAADVPEHRWRDATSDRLTRPVRLTVTEET
jgi:hypothetical protein